MNTIKPFANEEESVSIEGITVENRLDRISIYGSIDITRDKNGLALAKQLKDLLDQTLTVLEREDLPDQITVKQTDNVDNPFQ